MTWFVYIFSGCGNQLPAVTFRSGGGPGQSILCGTIELAWQFIHTERGRPFRLPWW